MPDKADKAKLVVRERITLKKWDHDCPTLHGGTCEPEVVVMEWANGEPVGHNRLEVKDATPNARS